MNKGTEATQRAENAVQQLQDLSALDVSETIITTIVELEGGVKHEFERPISDVAFVAITTIKGLIAALEAKDAKATRDADRIREMDVDLADRHGVIAEQAKENRDLRQRIAELEVRTEQEPVGMVVQKMLGYANPLYLVEMNNDPEEGDAVFTSAPAAQPDAVKLPDDARRMDWLVSKTVNVREPMVYGSHDLFWSQTTSEDWAEVHTSSLREQIDAAMLSGAGIKIAEVDENE